MVHFQELLAELRVLVLHRTLPVQIQVQNENHLGAPGGRQG